MNDQKESGKSKDDSQFRIVSLQSAIARAGQDGGLEGGFDVLALANVYYQWLTGKKDVKDPIFEQAQSKKGK